MRITCPICGERDRREFYYVGDAVALDALRPMPDQSLGRLRASSRQPGRRDPRPLVSRKRLLGLDRGRAQYRDATRF